MTSRSERYRRPMAVLAVLLAAVLAGCTSESSPTDPQGISTVEVAFHSFELVNHERRDAGVQPQLTFDDAVAAVARAHSEAMRDKNFFGHAGPDGNLTSRLAAAGIPYGAASENIARVSGGVNAAASAHGFLMASAQHRGNILNPRFRAVGVGVARDGSDWWFTQIFVRP